MVATSGCRDVAARMLPSLPIALWLRRGEGRVGSQVVVEVGAMIVAVVVVAAAVGIVVSATAVVVVAVALGRDFAAGGV